MIRDNVVPVPPEKLHTSAGKLGALPNVTVLRTSAKFMYPRATMTAFSLHLPVADHLLPGVLQLCHADAVPDELQQL